MTSERIRTGITGLDEMLFGGFLPGTAVLVEGAPGTGKSTLGMQFIQYGATMANEPGLMLTFETFPRQYYRDAKSFGWDFQALEGANKLRVIMSSPEVTLADLRTIDSEIEISAKKIGAKRIVVDSLSHFERITSNPIELRRLVFEFINSLKRIGLTILLTRESAALLGDTPELDEDLAFLVDGYLMLRYVELSSAVRKAMLILKLRGSDHAKDIRQYDIVSHGIEVASKFEGQAGIMSGTPISSAAEAFIQAFGRKK